MTPPFIGITTTHFKLKLPLPSSGISEAYIRAVHAAGGIPLLIPSGLSSDELQSLLSRLDGILFTGGGDIDPVHFHGTTHAHISSIIPERDETELNLVHLVTEGRLPFLGICRGIQVINVALGGTLYTHIADQLPGSLKHNYEERTHLAHAVQVKPGSQLASILGTTSLQTNSLHHQGLEFVSERLSAVAWASDGLVEAVELEGHPFGLAVQWHPEWLQEMPAMRNLFSAFVESARGK